LQSTLWPKCLGRLQDELSSQQFTTWIIPLQAVDDDNQLRLLAPNRFVLDWVSEKFLPRINELLEEIEPDGSSSVRLEIGSADTAFTKSAAATSVDVKLSKGTAKDFLLKPSQEQKHQSTSTNGASSKDTARAQATVEHESSLNTRFTFSNFVEGKSNQLGRPAALQVGAHPVAASTLYLSTALLA